MAILLTAIIGGVRADGVYPADRISDRPPMTVDEIEDRADAVWARQTAAKWREEDLLACAGGAGCMLRRSNTRILFMLRRNCVDVNAIFETCGLTPEVQ